MTRNIRNTSNKKASYYKGIAHLLVHWEHMTLNDLVFRVYLNTGRDMIR